VSDSEFHILNSWRQEDQSTHEVISDLLSNNSNWYIIWLLVYAMSCSNYHCIFKQSFHLLPYFGRVQRYYELEWPSVCRFSSELDLRYDYPVSPLRQLMSALAAVGPPNPREDPECCSILHGLVAAVESLSKITELQHERRTSMMDTAERVANRGRIICLTNAKR